jgi:hypothetical protein
MDPKVFSGNLNEAGNSFHVTIQRQAIKALYEETMPSVKAVNSLALRERVGVR